MVNPVDDFLAARKEKAEKRKGKEVAMWEAWKHAPSHEKPRKLEPLLKAYEPTFNTKVREWKPPAIPESAFRAVLTEHFVKALNIYDPTKAALSTHIEQRLQKAKRHVIKHQNIGYIPEGQVQYIGKINKAVDHLTEEFGRPPTHDEIADHLGMTPKKVNTIMQNLRRDVPNSKWESDPTVHEIGREQEVLNLLQYNLSPEEKNVFEYLYGQNGKPVIGSTNALAAKLGKSPSQISRLRTAILNKYKTYV